MFKNPADNCYETGIINTIDPLAGSYYIENLTNELENRAKELMEKIDKMGGLVKCIENGWIMKEVISSAYKVQKDIEEGRKVIVGVNKFISKISEGEKIKIQKLPDYILKNQISRLKKVKKERLEIKVKEKLDKLSKAAKNDSNLFPYVLEAVKVRATIGEIISTLKMVYGEYTIS